MEAFAIPLLLVVGSLLALQAAANVQLSAAMASPFGASTLQLGIGAALLIAVAALAGSLGALGLLDEAEPWQLVGGLGSALYITAGILLFPRLGALVAVGLFIAGQMLASLLLDGFGWLGVEQDAPGAAALTGALAVGAGVWLIVRAQAGAGALEVAARERGGWVVLGLAGGAVLPIQGAINAELNAELDAATAVGVPGGDRRDGARARRLPRGRGSAPAGRAASGRAVVGVAGRALRSDLRDRGLPADPRDRGRAGRRAHRRRPAARLRRGRPLRAPASAAPGDLPSPPRRRRPPALRRRAHHVAVTRRLRATTGSGDDRVDLGGEAAREGFGLGEERVVS
jgi:uncharacterized membrane protein YdcZ (DUF606 family)